MNAPLPTSGQPRRAAAGFTMVEIALCIAIVAIAMVAIMGVMPTGLTVQAQNREDTIIDQEAQILIDAIRGGSMRLNELTNYVDYIATAQHPTNSSPRRTNNFRGVYFSWPANSPLASSDRGLLNRSEDIVGLLSLPRLDFDPNDLAKPPWTNQVMALMRPFSGPLNEKLRPVRTGSADTRQLDFAFRYQLTSELVQVPVGPDPQQPFVSRDYLQRPVYEVRLTFRWPVFLANGEYRVGGNEKTYRTQVTGQFQEYRLRGERTAEIYKTGILRRRLNTQSIVQ